MNTLKQFQEEGEKKLQEKFGWLFASIKVTPSRDDDFEKAKILQSIYYKLSDDLKDFLSQQTTLAYELGKKEMLEMVVKDIEELKNNPKRDIVYCSSYELALEDLKQKLLALNEE